MSALSTLQAGVKKKEMEKFWTQLGRLKEKVEGLEERIFELGRMYCRLPLRLRNDSRMTELARKTLEEVFFEADEEAQEEFWGEAVEQARFVVRFYEETRRWAEYHAFEVGMLKQQHYPPEGRKGFLPLDTRHTGEAAAIASKALISVEEKVMTYRYAMMAFGKEELQEFYEQEGGEMQLCIDGAMRFLHFWPGTGMLLEEMEGVEEERRMGYLVGVFLGLEEMSDVREAQKGAKEEKEKEEEIKLQFENEVTIEPADRIKTNFENGASTKFEYDGIKMKPEDELTKRESEDGMKPEFEDGDSGVFLETKSIDSESNYSGSEADHD